MPVDNGGARLHKGCFEYAAAVKALGGQRVYNESNDSTTMGLYVAFLANIQQGINGWYKGI